MKQIAAICALIVTGATLFAGDIATFVDLGFSNDSRYYMFGNYGIDESGVKQYADLYVVDVWSNSFTSDGVKSGEYDRQAAPGQDGFGAMMTLYRESIATVRSFNIDHMNSGRLLYLLVDGDKPKSELEFRDFETGRKYSIALLQSTFGSGEQVSSSFHINLTVTTKSDDSGYYTIGLPDYRRSGVRSYRISRVLSSPDDASLVFVIEKEMYGEDGLDIRYMIETVKLR